MVTTSSDGTARLWDSSNGKRLSVLKHEKPVFNAVFSPDSKQVLTLSGKNRDINAARLWEVSSSKLIMTLDKEYYYFLFHLWHSVMMVNK
ncbi:WD40-repeat containing protein [Beggiatoa sp. PS]|nr:WD40-repeat containing protein [Beggiatoa sp. PS]